MSNRSLLKHPNWILIVLTFIVLRTLFALFWDVITARAESVCHLSAEIIFAHWGAEDIELALCDTDREYATVGHEPVSFLILDMGQGNEIVDGPGIDFYYYERPYDPGILLDNVGVSVAQDDNGSGTPAPFIMVFIWGDENPDNNGDIPSVYLPEEPNKPINSSDLHNETGVGINIGNDDGIAYRFIRIQTHPTDAVPDDNQLVEIDAVEGVHPLPSPTSTPTPFPTETLVPIQTPTPTALLFTSTATSQPTGSLTLTATPFTSETVTARPTETPPEIAYTPTLTSTDIVNPTSTVTPIPTRTPTALTVSSATFTPAEPTTATYTPAMTETPTNTSTFTETPIATHIPSATFTPTQTRTATYTQAKTATPTGTLTPTLTKIPTATFTPTKTYIPMKTITATHTPVVIISPTNTRYQTKTPITHLTSTASFTSTKMPTAIYIPKITSTQKIISKPTTPTVSPDDILPKIGFSLVDIIGIIISIIIGIISIYIAIATIIVTIIIALISLLVSFIIGVVQTITQIMPSNQRREIWKHLRELGESYRGKINNWLIRFLRKWPLL